MHYSRLGEAAIDAQPQESSTYAQAAAEAGPSEEAGYYVYKHSLLANANEPDLTQFIDGDSDFMLVSLHGISTGTYSVNIKDNSGKPIYSTAADARNAVGTAQLPRRIRPALSYPAAGKIGISLIDTSGAPNAVELVFSGIRRFRTR